MSDFDLFNELAAQSKEIEESGNTRNYQSYINTLLDQLKNREKFVTDHVTTPVPNSYGEYVCIKEPLEFIKLFEKYSFPNKKLELLLQRIDNNPNLIRDEIVAKISFLIKLKSLRLPFQGKK